MNIIDFFFPKKCFGCSKHGNYFCDLCRQNLLIPKQICIECFKPSVDGKTHVKCQKKISLDGFTSVFKYEGAVKRSLISLKYKFAYDIAYELSEIITNRLLLVSFLFSGYSLVIPVPLHKKRENWRGFNQSEIFGKKIAEFFKFEYCNTALTKLKNQKPQTLLKRDERLKNVKNSYEIINKSQIANKNILLIDDVITTGATIKETCKILKENGARLVWGVAIAH